MVRAAHGRSGPLAAACRAFALLAGFALAGCGPDMAGAAAGGAAASAAELKQAQADQARAMARIKEAEKAQQAHLEDVDRAADGKAP